MDRIQEAKEFCRKMNEILNGLLLIYNKELKSDKSKEYLKETFNNPDLFCHFIGYLYHEIKKGEICHLYLAEMMSDLVSVGMSIERREIWN